MPSSVLFINEYPDESEHQNTGGLLYKDLPEHHPPEREWLAVCARYHLQPQYGLADGLALCIEHEFDNDISDEHQRYDR